MPYITFQTHHHLGLITLTRPQALNAMDTVMAQTMTDTLASWREDPAVEIIVIRGGEKAFCAGGDIKAVWAQPDRGAEFFRTEYRLVQAISEYPKPYVALMHGIVMGGGAGIAINGSYRVATETTLFAMPETAIGFFPDVGASHFLSRLPDHVGRYLALTGARIGAGDLMALGLATHYVPSGALDDLMKALAVLLPEKALGRYAETAPLPTLPRDVIGRCFASDTMEGIMTALEREPGTFAADTLAALRRMVPTSLEIALRQMIVGAGMEFDACIAMERRLAEAMRVSPDFREGVRAMLVDKDQKPKWAALDIEFVTKLFARYPLP